MAVITLSGPGGHTARPELTVDLVELAARDRRRTARRASLRECRRRPTPTVKVVFGSIHAGDAANVIPTHCILQGVDTDPVAGGLGAAPRRWSSGRSAELLADTGAGYEVDYTHGVPPVVNDARVTEMVRRAAASEFGAEAVVGGRAELGRRRLRLVHPRGARDVRPSRRARRRNGTHPRPARRVTSTSTSERSRSAFGCWSRPSREYFADQRSGRSANDLGLRLRVAGVARVDGRNDRSHVAGDDVASPTLDGYGRRWNYGSMHLRGDWTHDGVDVVQGLVVSLGLTAADGESCNGVIVRVDADELAQPRLARARLRAHRHHRPDERDRSADVTSSGRPHPGLRSAAELRSSATRRPATTGRAGDPPVVLGTRRQGLRRARRRPPRALRRDAGARCAGGRHDAAPLD